MEFDPHNDMPASTSDVAAIARRMMGGKWEES